MKENKKVKRKIKNKRERGITLIALVITIIVLLILAGVSIAMLTGQNGILTQAQKAGEETEIGEEKEAISLAYNGAKAENNGGDVDADDLNRNFGYNDTKAEATDVGDGTITVKFEESQRIYTIDANGNISEPTTGTTPTPPTTGPEIDPTTGLYVSTSTKDGNKATAMNPTIPVGFKPVDTETSKWGNEGEAPTAENVNNGLVIEDKEGNEFVWIPVETPVVSSEEEEEEQNKKAMAVEVGENYRGLLYTFNDDYTSTVRSGCTTTNFDNNSSYREPTLVDDDSSNGVTDLQSEYNKMITSVLKYNGFYIGRYELGLDTKNANAPTSQKEDGENGVETADAGSSSLKNWYGLYNKCKEYAPEEGTKSVVSSMTWGSQYDAMMNWMQKNDINVTATGNRNEDTTTGISETDLLKNIYDLYGCHFEWTSEANYASSRVIRRWLFRQQLFASA